MKTVIHLGYPRTGTTSLQFGLFLHLPDYRYLGKPLIHFNERIKGLFVALMDRDTFTWQDGLDSFRQTLAGLRDAERHLLISEEEFATGRLRGADRAQIADRLCALFPEAEIVVTLRRQEDVLPSVFNQLSAVGLVVEPSYSAWLARERASLGTRSVLDLYRYGPLLDAYAERFAGRLKILLFEDLRDAPEQFFGGLGETLGLDPTSLQETYEREKTAAGQNARLNAWELRYEQARRALAGLAPLVMSLPPLGELEAEGAGPSAALRRALAEGPRVDTSVSEEDVSWLRELYAEENARIAERYGLDLAGRGYCLPT